MSDLQAQVTAAESLKGLANLNKKSACS
jgi:hypothetical protein